MYYILYVCIYIGHGVEYIEITHIIDEVLPTAVSIFLWTGIRFCSISVLQLLLPSRMRRLGIWLYCFQLSIDPLFSKFPPQSRVATNRRPCIVGNWGSEKLFESTVYLATEIGRKLSINQFNADVVVCPSLPFLSSVCGIMNASQTKTGSQYCFYEEKGMTVPAPLSDIH